MVTATAAMLDSWPRCNQARLLTREALGATHNESTPAAAQRVVRDLDQAIEREGLLRNERAAVVQALGQGLAHESLPDAARRISNDRDRWHTASLDAGRAANVARDFMGAALHETLVQAARRVSLALETMKAANADLGHELEHARAQLEHARAQLERQAADMAALRRDRHEDERKIAAMSDALTRARVERDHAERARSELACQRETYMATLLRERDEARAERDTYRAAAERAQWDLTKTVERYRSLEPDRRAAECLAEVRRILGATKGEGAARAAHRVMTRASKPQVGDRVRVVAPAAGLVGCEGLLVGVEAAQEAYCVELAGGKRWCVERVDHVQVMPEAEPAPHGRGRSKPEQAEPTTASPAVGTRVRVTGANPEDLVGQAGIVAPVEDVGSWRVLAAHRDGATIAVRLDEPPHGTYEVVLVRSVEPLPAETPAAKPELLPVGTRVRVTRGARHSRAAEGVTGTISATDPNDPSRPYYVSLDQRVLHTDGGLMRSCWVAAVEQLVDEPKAWTPKVGDLVVLGGWEGADPATGCVFREEMARHRGTVARVTSSSGYDGTTDRLQACGWFWPLTHCNPYEGQLVRVVEADESVPLVLRAAPGFVGRITRGASDGTLRVQGESSYGWARKVEIVTEPKVGDRVRVTYSSGGGARLAVGHTGRIVEIDEHDDEARFRIEPRGHVSDSYALVQWATEVEVLPS